VVLFGGRSAEHDISCISASHVLAAVEPSRYEVVPIGITRSGRFVLAERLAEMTADGPTVDALPAMTGTASADDADLPTVVFPILHGPNGEDGTVQGMLQLAGLPYVGAGVLSSALAMDKAMAKLVMQANDIAQVGWRTIDRSVPFGATDAIAAFDELGPTLFVKPANMGSSIGVSRVMLGDGPREGPSGLVDAVAAARRFDELVVIEQGVVGRELECAVLGNDRPRASVVGEVVTDAEFYDYGDKYFDGTARTVIPAELDPDVADDARALAVRTFAALRCTGMARVDMFATDAGLLVNEVNTIPGFTPISMYPKLWEASGLGYPELIDELVSLAIEEHGRRSALATQP